MSQKSIRKDVISVGSANAFSYLAQFLLPIVLTRVLLPDDFAGYRMVWLVVSTLLVFAPLQIPDSLSYFLPREKNYSDRASYIVGALIILTASASIASLVVNPWYPLLPLEWLTINGPDWFFSAIIFFWVIANMLDLLPVGDGRPGLQAVFILTFALTRVISISFTAWLTGSLEAILYVMIALVLFKLSLLFFYILKFHDVRRVISRNIIYRLLSYSWSFGVSNALYFARIQLEIWMVAALFMTREFAAFSLGSVATPIFGLIRRSVFLVTFPNISKLEQNQDKKGIASLNRKATSSVAFIIYPLAVFLWVFAEEIISIVYTSQYVDAAFVMRVYMLGVIPMVMESTLLMRVSGLGKAALKINFFMIPLVLLLSYFGIQMFGLPGGAIGSTTAVYLSRYLEIKKGANHLDIPILSLYDFRSLAKILLVSIISAFIARYSVDLLGSDSLLISAAIGFCSLFIIFLLVSTIIRIVPGPIVRTVSSKFLS